MSYRFVNPAPIFGNLLGTGSAANGTLRFYENGTTTPKTTWSDPDLTTPNGFPIQLDASGRSDVEIFLDGAYSVELRDADGTQVWSLDNVLPSGGDAGGIPALLAGAFLTNDGANLLWALIQAIPDPTGYGGNILGTDGVNVFWVPPTEIPAPPPADFELTASGFRMGQFFMQWGTDTAPAAPGSDVTSKNVTFPEAFAEAPFLAFPMTATSNINGTSLVATAATNLTVSGFTGTFNNADRHYSGSSKLDNPIPFTWFAIGKKAA